MGIVADFRWHMRARASRGSSLDKMRTADLLGRPAEVVAPRWWDARRWWAWLRADGYYEAVLHGPDGVARFYRMRTRTVPRPQAQPIAIGGKRVVPRPVTKEQLEEYVRRRHPDALAEQMGVEDGQEKEE